MGDDAADEAGVEAASFEEGLAKVGCGLGSIGEPELGGVGRDKGRGLRIELVEMGLQMEGMAGSLITPPVLAASFSK